MCKEIRGNQKHMSLEDRNYIEQALGKEMSFKEIAKFLRKDPTTISKEVKNHRVCKPRNTYGARNDCIAKQHCTVIHACGNLKCLKHCASCPYCRDHCPVYSSESCKHLRMAPFVCNGCETRKACRIEKYYYRSLSAHNRYRHYLSVSREGINLTPAQLSDLDELATPFILKGQPIAHIFAKNANANIYYCDPYSSYQKGRLEKNHKFIRYVVPKGKSFDGYIQEDITLMINHINSTARDSLNGRNPFELDSLLSDKSVIETMDISEIIYKYVITVQIIAKANGNNPRK